MENNELQLNKNEINNNFQIENFDNLKSKYDKVASQYDGYQVNFDNYDEAKRIVRNIRKNNRSVNRFRIDLGKDTKDKLKSFKNQTDTLTKNLDDKAEKIQEQIINIDLEFTDKRKQIVTKVVNKMCDERNMKHVDIDPKWYEKSNCKRNGEPNSKCLELINASLKLTEANRINQENDIRTIEQKANELSLSSDGYVDSLKDGMGLDWCLSKMENKAQQRKNEQQKTTVVHNYYVDKETGEITAERTNMNVELKGSKDNINRLKNVAKRLNIDWKEV